MKNLDDMKKAVLFFAIGLTPVVVVAVDGGRVFAGENSVTCERVFKFSMGVVAAFAIHEGAHGIAAESVGEDLEWETGTINQPVGFTGRISDKEKGLFVYSAGLMSQAIGSEIILQVDRIDKNDDFVRGMMVWNIINPAWYALDYWFIHRTNWKEGGSLRGDIEGIEYYSDKGTANAFATAAAALAAFQGYRFLKTQSWAPDWLKGDQQSLNFEPIHAKGFMIRYKTSFR